MTKRFEGTAIGIDLGTTYSCVAAWFDGQIKIIRNEQGNKITPSCVAWDGTHLLVGELAKNQITTNPKNTVYDVKRLIGKRFSDVRVENDIKSWPFKVIEDSGDKPMVVFEDKSIVKKFSAQEISSMILKRLKDAAEAVIETKVTHAVITVPAYFSDQQRQATKDAGKLAGLNVMHLISEPTSAAIAYALDKMADKNVPRDKNVFVFDMGGGTFDVSLLNMSKSGIITVKSVGGDTHMGGEDFDKVMVDYCVHLFMKKEKMDVTKNAKAMARLKEACEKAKRALSGTTITTIEIACLHEEIDFSMKFCRAKFEELNAGIFKKCIEHVESCLRNGNMHKNNVDDVVIVGGSTRIPKIQQMLMDFFDGKPLCKSVRVDAVVAYGAAVLAANLTGNGNEMVRNFRLVDVNPLSLGVVVRTNDMSVVIPKNTPIPTMKECDYYTRDDNQVSAEIRVYEGEERKIHKNIFLDKFILHDIPPTPAGEQKINVCFNIDSDGILSVSAEVKSTGNKKTIRIDKGGNDFSNCKIFSKLC